MANYTIEKRCDFNGYLLYVIMRDDKEYIRITSEGEKIAEEVVKKLTLADKILAIEKKENIDHIDSQNEVACILQYVLHKEGKTY